MKDKEIVNLYKQNFELRKENAALKKELKRTSNALSFANNKIYYNNVEICNGVESLTILQGKNGDGVNKDIVYITVNFKNFTESMNYKIEEIY